MPLSQSEEKGASSFLTPSRSRWFNSLLGSRNQDSPNTSLNVSNLSFTSVDDLELETGLEVCEDLAIDNRHFEVAFNEPRHLEEIKGSDVETQSWRMRERMKTVSVALVICLNVGVDPPDVTKTQPCARVECWIDPTTVTPQRALESIGNSLQRQYERWQPRARYKQSLDPTVEEVRRLATGLRRGARDERVLFHYNGHGVPKPTANGEIWVFNRTYTQYIPLSLYDLQSWMGSPSIFVYDCSNAGMIVSCFEQFAEQHEKEYLDQVNAQGISSSDLPAPVSPRSCIQLAACAANQLLPMNPELPADLFTACLTTPIKMALRWFVMQNQGKLAPKITLEMLDKIPGQFGDRRTMLGELNWIFTAITDTIAWNTLSRSLFQKLFRQDLLVASLFRNFLLAERVLKSYDCTPVSQPALPSMHQHPIWQAWDLAVDMALSQLPDIINNEKPYNASTFFEEQLTAFEVWLKYGNERRPPPEQLPIVLQVLLSQAHRFRALDLLGRFLDLGPWAVNLALSVGIFPYVLKLLQSSARELRPLLVSIWAKILAVDSSCQNDLVRDASHKYFINVLQDECMMPQHRTWAAFILASIVHNYRNGQQEAEQSNLIAICLEHLDDPEPVLRQWLAIAVGRVWDHYAAARWRGARDNAHEKLYELLKDPVPETRAAAVFALGTFINSCEERTEHANSLDHSIALHLLKVCEDGSPLVRQELVVALQYVVLAFESNFVNLCLAAAEEEDDSFAKNGHSATANKNLSPYARMKRSGKDLKPLSIQPSASSSALDRLSGGVGGVLGSARGSGSLSLSISTLSFSHVYSKIFCGLIFLCNDPHHEVSNMANKLIDYLRQRAVEKEAVIAARTTTTSHSESSSVPSSPARPSSFVVPGARPQGVASQVSTITEESSECLSTSVDGSASRLSRMTRGGSVGRHPSGGHHPGIASSGNLSASSQALMSNSETVVANAKPIGTLSVPVRKQIVPPQLSTDFISWSAKFFTRQLMKHECKECDCDHESERHWRRDWLLHRNSEIRLEAEQQNDLLRCQRSRIDASVSNFGCSNVLRNVPALTPSSILFHPLSHEIVIAGDTQVTVWNTQQAKRTAVINIHDRKLSNVGAALFERFSSHHGVPAITSLEYINPHDESILLVCCDNGSIQMFRDYSMDTSSEDDYFIEEGDPELGSLHALTSKVKLVTAWNGLRDLSGLTNQPLYRNSSLMSSMASLHLGRQNSAAPVKTAWDQWTLTLAVGGNDARYIRLWDANNELRKSDLPTCSESRLAHLSFGANQSGLLCAGFMDGSVRLYDQRLHDSCVLTFEGHHSPVLDCSMKGSEHHRPLLVFGDATGTIYYHELRYPDSKSRSPTFAKVSITPAEQTITRLAIHPRADLLAVWAQQSVSMHYFNPISNSSTSNVVNVIKHHEEGVLGQRLGYEGILSFHPELLQISIGSKDGLVSLKGFRRLY